MFYKMSKSDVLARIKALQSSWDKTTNSNNSLVFLTTAGIITGDVVLNPEEDNTVLIRALNESLDMAKETNISDETKMGIVLKNVEVLLSDNSLPVPMPSLFLFVEDILGISIGQLTYPEN